MMKKKKRKKESSLETASFLTALNYHFCSSLFFFQASMLSKRKLINNVPSPANKKVIKKRTHRLFSCKYLYPTRSTTIIHIYSRILFIVFFDTQSAPYIHYLFYFNILSSSLKTGHVQGSQPTPFSYQYSVLLFFLTILEITIPIIKTKTTPNIGNIY
jgi:hypothetical protein